MRLTEQKTEKTVSDPISPISLMVDDLQSFFADRDELELAVLIGSRAFGRAREESDWDFAVQWRKGMPFGEVLERTELLRAQLANHLGTASDNIDLVDIPSARLAMRAVIAEEGVLLKGDNTLPWSHFLLRTWRDLEDFYWEKPHAA